MKLFNESAILPEVLEAIAEMGFEKPTDVQSVAIPFLLENDQDLIALAQTGTGKTAAFGLPIITQTDTSKPYPQSLIICPTRELCLQIERDLQNFCKHLPLRTVAVYGGASIDTQLRAIKRGVQIVVATPGRLIDIIKRRKIDLSHVENLVLDESDEMLNMGFQEDIDSILEQTPENKRTLLFSATMPPNVRRIANNYMTDPHEITVGSKNAGADTVTHQLYMVNARDRYTTLKRVADSNPDIYGIVFCRTRAETKDIAEKLMADGYSADALHGDLSQAQRDYVMKKFRGKTLNMLVATDVAARGLDVQELTHVINFSLPDDVEIYTHRSGRTGRAGKKGISIAITNLREKGKVRQIERIIKKSFEVKTVPTGQEICEVKMKDLIEKIQNVEVNESAIAKLQGTISAGLDQFSKEELIQKFVSFEFNRVLEYYQNASDVVLNPNDRGGNDRRDRGGRDRDRGGRDRDRGGRDRDRGERRDRGDRGGDDRGRNPRSRSDYARFFINLGKKDSVDKSEMLRLLNANVNDRDVHYGAIDILKSFSFFEVESSQTEKILSSFKNAEHEGRRVSVEVAQAPQGKSNRGTKDDFIKGDSYRRGRSDDRNRSYDRKRGDKGRGSRSFRK